MTRVISDVSAGSHSAGRRVEGAVAGTTALSQLTPEEALVANAEIDAAISERARDVDFGAVLASAGITTVALDDEGRLVRYDPDGTATVLD